MGLPRDAASLIFNLPDYRVTFAEFTGQVPRQARATARLREAVVGAVIDSGRAVSETARAHGVSWWLVQAALTAAAVLLPEVDALPVTRIGVDEHRYRAVRYFRTPAGGGAGSSRGCRRS